MIVFLIAGQKKQYEGVVRPFCNFANGLYGKTETSFALLNCGHELVMYLKENLGVSVVASDNHNQLVTELAELKPKIVIGDDDLSRLRLLNAVKRGFKNVKVVAYVQILYGSHAICRNFDLGFLPLREKMLFYLCRFLPFLTLTRHYTTELNRCDFVIANSKSTATFLQTLYGTDVHGIVYPPVDTEVFKPILSNKDSKEVVLYLGSHAGDTPASFTEAIVKNVLRSHYTVNIFGNTNIASAIKSKHPEVIYHRNLEDKELAKLYSRSIFTICPQRWETFGYVPIESMTCGTPVLVFDCMGSGETGINGKTGWLATNNQKFLEMLDFVLENKEIQPDRDFIRKHVEENFSINASLKKLEKVLRITVDG